MDQEMKRLHLLEHGHPLDRLEPVISGADLVACQRAVREVHVDEKVRRYLMQLVHETRSHDDLSLGASPRASLALFRTGQAMAAILGRNFVLPDDIKRVAPAVLTHRLIVRPESRLRKVTAAAIVDELLGEIPVPTMTAEARAS
jgi:MoxR-like ATPase